MVPKGTKLYYASAKFRELQLDKMMHQEPVPDFPILRNFFVGRSQDAMRYSATVNNLTTYYSLRYGEDPENYQSRNFDVTHVYTVKRDIKLMNLMDRENITHLIYRDPDSPFHVSKIDIPLHKDNSPYHTLRHHDKGRELMKKHGVEEKHMYSGFVLLIMAMGYYLPVLKRASSVFYDYTIIELLQVYIQNKGIDIDGWFQPDAPEFHQEYAIFNPVDTLKPDYKSPLSWRQHIPAVKVSEMTVNQRFKFHLDIVEKWRINVIKQAQESIKFSTEAIADLTKNGTSSQTYIEEVDATGEDMPVEKLIETFKELIRGGQQRIHNIATEIPLVSSLRRSQKIKTSIQIYYNEKVHSCKFGGCDSPVTFETDSCKKSLNDLAREMRLYPNANNLHHNGQTVADHCIWVTRAAHKWLGYSDHPWTIGIDPALRNLTLISAFLHDIGKIGDNDTWTLPNHHVKPDHPYRGFNYMMKWLDFRYLNSSSMAAEKKLDILNDCNVKSSFDIATVATVVALHHHLGELLMQVDYLLPSQTMSFKGPHVLTMTVKKYFGHKGIDGYMNTSYNLLRYVLDTMMEFKYILYYFDFLNYYQTAGGNIDNKKELHQALLILLAVSAADVYGSHEVPDNAEKYSIYDASTSAILDPSILTIATHKHASIPEIFRGYYNYMYYTFGLKERSNMMAFANTVQDTHSFVEAWKHFEGLLNHIHEPEKFRLPLIFCRLATEDIQTFLTDLLRLLKTGQLPTGTDIKRLPNSLCKQLLRPGSSRDPLVNMFKTHRHKGLAQQAPDLGTVSMSKLTDRARSAQAPF